MQTAKQMKQFMEPQSVALIGVSRYTGEGTFNILENLLSYGYQGKIYPVNPNASEILGIRTYSSITEVTDNVDLAIITTPRSLVPRLVRECSQSNIQAIEIVAQGFTDANDDEGKQLQKEINDIARTSHIRIVGPNTFGTANAFINFSSSFVKIRMEKKPIGVICQTGVFFVGFPEAALIGKGLDLGNACDISFAEGLEYFESDPQTNVVVLHIEGMQDTKRFIDIARRTARTKPVVALKTGRSQQAAKAAQSHTGSLIGRNEVWQAALKQSGVIQASDLEEFIDLARTFSVLPLMEKPRIGVVTISGGLGIVTIDGSQQSGLEIGQLSANTKKLLDAMSPSWLNISNPVDIWPAMMTSPSVMKPLIDGLEALLSDEQLGAALFIGGAFDEKWATRLCQLLTELAVDHQDKPVACCIYGPYGDEAIRQLQDAGKAVGFPTPERA
ncbi:MAG: CoA-binding protein, partial [Dehalococcoidia bacterium]|nr:CoA-binding protein [Dehalococcoidia bacterium]